MRNALFIVPLVATTYLCFTHLKSSEYRPPIGTSGFIGLSTDTVKKKITNQISNTRMRNGKHFVSAAGGVKLFANIQKGEVKKFTAIDDAGKDINVTTSKSGVKCLACVENSTTHLTVCWEIPCKDLPRPPDEKAKIVN